MAKARIAINGFGRIGRLFFRAAFGSPDIEIVAINDLGDVENLAYLLKYDTVYGRYAKDVKADVAGGKLIVDGTEVKFLQVKDPTQLPWKDLNIDIVIESTGLFDSYEKSKVHLAAGAKRVVITAPAKDDDGAGRQDGSYRRERRSVRNMSDHVQWFLHDEFRVAGHPDFVGESRAS